jgi:hypothetical protein
MPSQHGIETGKGVNHLLHTGIDRFFAFVPLGHILTK